MNMFLPALNTLSVKKSVKNPSGFTLVELLIVIAIIAILTAIGFAVFGNQSGKARDARRKADIDQISKAYEVNYDQEKAEYRELTATDFTSGAKPKDPRNTDYNCDTSNTNNFGAGCISSNKKAFKICALLDDNSTYYCRSSAQGNSSPSPSPTSSPTSAPTPAP